MNKLWLALFLVFVPLEVLAECQDMEVFDVGMQMCMPRAMSGMSMQMLMIHGNSFVVDTVQSGPRGRNGVAFLIW